MILSVDCATKSGVALWDADGKPSAVWTVRPVGDGPAWAKWARGRKLATYVSRWQAWVLPCGVTHIVAALERGKFKGPSLSLGRSLGFVEGVAASIGAAFVPVELSTWHRSISEEMAERGSPITWPPGETKRVSIATAKTLYPQLGEGVTDDEAEAVLIGHAARRLRLV